MPVPRPLPIVKRPAEIDVLASGWRRRFGASRGLLVVGHGTADPVGAGETGEITRLAAALLPGVPVELGFLEVIGPSIGEALARLAAQGCREVVAAPLLLFTAGHARRDVPEALAAGALDAGVVVRQAEALGCHPEIVALARRRRREAVEGLEGCPAESGVLLTIGRGSSDPRALAQLEEFIAATCATTVADCRGSIHCARHEFGFVAAARPSLAESIEAAALGGPAVRRVIVQPHRLFRGHVEEQVAAAVAQGRARHPQVEWVVVKRLGPDEQVARALIDRAAAVAW